MAELNKINNPNNTDTFRRRGTWEREMDNDGNSNAAADADYSANIKKFDGSRCDDQAASPTRDTKPPKNR